MSNLKNGLSGSSVNISKIKLHLSACRRCHAEVAADLISLLSRAVTRPYLRGDFACVLSTPHALLLAINRSTPSSFPFFTFCSAPPPACSAARRSLRRAASAVPSYAYAIVSVLRFSASCLRRLGWPESPGATASSPSPAGAHHHCLDVARPFQTISAFTKPTDVTVVSH